MTYYDLLGARPGARPTELRRAYLRAARRTHPDHGGTDAAFHEVQAAWATLGHPGRRAAYDLEHLLPPPPEAAFDARPLVRPVRLSVLGPVGLSGALTTATLAATQPLLLLVGAAYVLLTMLAVARRIHPTLRGRLRWPDERTYRTLLVGAWVIAGGFLLTGALAWTLDRSPTTPLLLTACTTTFAVATAVAGEFGRTD